MTGPTVRVVTDPAALALAGAELFVDVVTSAIAGSGRATVALSGGSTPRALHRLLAEDPKLRGRIDWGRVHFFWGDERHVPPDHPESNYRMARETLLDHVPVPPAHVHRIPSEEPEAAVAAQRYERDLQGFFGRPGGPAGGWPRLDLVLLGMGPDGHTASLFPGTGAVHEARRLVVAPWVEKLGAFRISLTAPVLNHAARVAVMVAGADKAATVKAVLDGPVDLDRYPVQVVRPGDGQLTWLLDRAAAAQRPA
jgi:6-phosphogluconolactonase